MIVRPIGPEAVFYRLHSPRWASQTLSGEGAAKQGGRFNRRGTPALYLASDLPTAQAEYQQGEVLMPPATAVSYQVTLERVVDLSGGYDPNAWEIEWQDWGCDWRALLFNDGIEPPSWLLADLALEAGANGILFPSLRRTEPGSLNLAVFTATLSESSSLRVHDPRGDLPRDQESWR